MFFGSVGGLTVFSPDRLKDNPFIPPVVLTSFKKLNREVVFDKPLWAVREIVLPYKENFFSFEFAALDYTNPAKNRYTYRMKGADHTWINSGNRHFASYSGLSPGRYEFHIKGSNSDGVWNEKGVNIKITIIPPFWVTWWFRVLVVFLIVLSVFIAYRIRIHQIEKRNRELSEANIKLEEQVRKRRQAEEALLESRERLETVINHAPVMLWAIDRDGIFTFSEGRSLETLGIKPAEMLGRSLFDLYADYPEVTAAARRALEGETFSDTVTAGGLVFEIRYSPLKNKQGQLVGAIGVAADETERKRAEAEKELLQDQLRHVQKLETIGTLAGGIAHDFNNMLGPILGYTEMALEETPRDHVTWMWLEEVLKGVNRAKELVRQILVFARRDKQVFKPVRIQFIIKEALKLIRASFPTTVEIQQEIDGECEPVLADPTQVHQVCMNLCANARDAMQENGGILKVELKMVDVDAELAGRLPNLKAGKYVRFTVSDTGSGIGPENMRRLFEPFFTTKAPGEGTGMGLSVVHGIVMAHGGEITVFSEEGKGSCFNVFFPVTEHKISERPAEKPEFPRGSEHVMVVDDEESMAIMAGAMLEKLGYKVTVATQSTKALTMFEENPLMYNLVITDQIMPHLTGTQLAKKMKAIRDDLPIVIMSGLSDSVEPLQIEEFGTAAYLEKPFDIYSLGILVRKLLDTPPGRRRQKD